jgi:hypothetical protein
MMMMYEDVDGDEVDMVIIMVRCRKRKARRAKLFQLD